MSDTFMLRLGTALSAAALAAFGALVLEIAPAAAQEFDCRKASYASERTICRHEKLGALDEKMSGLYGELLDSTSSRSKRSDIKDYQRQFLDARDSCRNDANCIKGAYLDHIDVLEDQLARKYRSSER